MTAPSPPHLPSFYWSPIRDGAEIWDDHLARQFIDQWIGPYGSMLQVHGGFYKENDEYYIVHDPSDPSLIDPDDQMPLLYLHVTYSGVHSPITTGELT